MTIPLETSLRGVRLLCLPCCLLLALLLPPAAFSRTPSDVTPKTLPAESRSAQESPEVEQVVPMSAILAIDAAEAGELLNKWNNQAKISAQLDSNQQTLITIDQRIAGWGPLEQWSEGRLLGAKQRLTAVRNQLLTQLEQLTLALKTHEELQLKWTGRLSFWEGWEKSLQSAGIKVPTETFIKNRAVIHGVLDRAAQATASHEALQQRLASQQAIVGAWLTQFDNAIANLRGSIFERKAPPLFSREFATQFNQSLWAGLREDIVSSLRMPDDFALRQGWVAAVQLIAALVIAWHIYRRGREPEPVPEALRFFFRHPVAGGLFTALIGGGLLYVSPPPLWQWLMRVLATLSATILICAMLERPRLRRVIITLAVLYICATTIRMIGLVQPLHRLFLAGVCAIAVPLCLAAARRERRRNDGRLNLLATAFYLGTLAGTVGLIAQIGGYSSMTPFLVYGFLGSTFVYLFARMALHLGSGGITALLDSSGIRDRRFVRRLGSATGARLKMLMQVIVITYAFLYLSVHWDFYLTPGEAWTGLMALSFKVGELQISLEIVVMVALVLYLSIIISWIIQALLDAEIMTPQGLEHGVKFAVKTLIHYSLILVGFLVAISVAGVDMSKFAILAGALGVGIGFGLQNIVNNFISGLILLFERPIKIGDTVTIDDQWGTITRIGLRSTVVETIDRAELIVPNSELVAQKVTNWTFTTHVSRVVITVGVAYGTPLESVLEILLRVAREQRAILDEPPPSAIFTGFGDSSINFELRAWIADINQRPFVRSELGLAIDREFRAAGIVIPFPQRDLHLHGVVPNLQDSPRQGGHKTAKVPKDSAE